MSLPSAAYAWQWQTSGVNLDIDTHSTGQITRWQVDGRTMVQNLSPDSPLTLTDTSGLKWSFKANHFTDATTREGQSPSVRITGVLSADAGHAVPATLTYDLLDAGRKIRLSIESAPPADTMVRDFSWRLPLGLQPRKRVFYMSDYGLEWDTRYFYQLTVNPTSKFNLTGKAGPSDWGILDVPDRNIWRYFSLDQLSPDAYRLWKAAEDGNAPLTMHQGRHPAPAVQVYDEHAGIDVEYPDLRAQAPASLRIDASSGGKVEIQFWPSFSEPTEARKTNAFVRHEIVLTSLGSEKEALQDQAAWHDRYADTFTPRPDPAAILDEPDWVTRPALEDRPMDVTGGYPFARGMLKDIGTIQVAVSGQPVPVQAKPLGFWPDGSVKWALLTFPVDPAKAVADCPPPRVSLRSGRYLPISVSIGQPATPTPAPASAERVTVEHLDNGDLTISTGDLVTTLGTGQNWLRKVSLHGQPVIESRKNTRDAYTDYLRDPTSVFPFDQQAAGGHIDPGTLDVDSIRVEESGPRRAVIRLEGLTTNREPTRIILRLEFLAGRDAIRLTHTAVFRYQDARKVFLTGMGLELPLGPDIAQASGQRSVRLTQESSFLRTLTANGIDDKNTKLPSGWLRAGGAGPGVTAVLRNFREMSPMALSTDPASATMRLEFWPSRTHPMDTRRYSDFLHFAQLESASTDSPATWVRDDYYPKGSFYGVSCTHEALLSFDDGRPVDGERLAADFQSPPLLYAGWDTYLATGIVTDQATAAAWPRMWDTWTRLARFFLYHRELHDWHGLWTFGDFRHRFRGGFGWTVPPEVLEAMPEGSVKDRRLMDNRPANDWCYDTGAYGWSNTEGLPNLFLQNEYLRHGNRPVYFAAEELARHSRDVVVRQEGPLLGKGSRHGVQPWSAGNHEERQTTATEYRLHYFLSGDGRTRDVIENLYTHIYDRTPVSYIASHSGRLPGLLFHWELTGDPAEGKRLARYVSDFVSDQGIYAAPNVSFPEATNIGPPSLLNSGSQFLNTFGAMHTLIEYQKLTGDEALTKALILMADAIIKQPIIESGRLGEGDYSWPAVAFAALHADNPQPYRAFLIHYLESYGWRNAYQPVTANPAHWSGATGMMVRIVPLTFFWANWAPYVGAALPEGEVWTPKIAADYAGYEKNGNPYQAHRPGWQSQFDDFPKAKAYLAPQQPWTNPPHETQP
ncbi:MAG TPA: hypothetical protein VIO38_14615 [Rariglobus sp.]